MQVTVRDATAAMHSKNALAASDAEVQCTHVLGSYLLLPCGCLLCRPPLSLPSHPSYVH